MPALTMESFLQTDWFGLPHATVMGMAIRPQHMALALLAMGVLGPVNGAIVALVVFMICRAPAAAPTGGGQGSGPVARAAHGRSSTHAGVHTIHELNKDN
jgi:hypothetical protein